MNWLATASTPMRPACWRWPDDAPRRAALRERLLQPHALFDGEPMARALEALWTRMWQRALAGQKPAALPAVAP